MEQKLTDLTIRRIDRFYTRLGRYILPLSTPLSVTCAPCARSDSFANRLRLDYRPIAVGDVWGHAWEPAWFHLTGRVPSAWRDKQVVAHLDVGGEGLVFLPDGRALQGITNGSVFDSDFGRDIVPLYDRCQGDENVDLWIEASSNALFGLFANLDPNEDASDRFGYYDAKLNQARLAVLDSDIWALRLDLRTIIGMIKALPEKSVRRARVIRLADEAIAEFGRSGGDPRICREVLQLVLKSPAAPSSLSVLAVGHAHIDTAWLWPVEETIRKCGRTFATQLDLIGRYPAYVFGASQAQHYAFVKEYYPELYQRVKAAIIAGRWEVQGGMWVEADCNVTGGESLIRQILHGKNFFRDEFGVDIDNLWLPDVFGYSAALPQILRKSGIDYFLTQKLSWSQFNDFPHHTFRWQGIDGSEVVTHFPPENNYNSPLTPEYVIAAEERFKEKDFIDEFISLFGIGDGGGGPKEEYIELGRRMADLEGAPRVRFGTAMEFFHGLDKYFDRLPVWVGELYLELHRGTFTTQAAVKRANRQLEHRLRALEFLASCLPMDAYPQESLDTLWKTTLLNQFHDILPGSCINPVYKTTRVQHTEALGRCDSLMHDIAGTLFEKSDGNLVLFNTLSCRYEGAVVLPAQWHGCGLKDDSGAMVPTQTEGERLVALVDVPPCSLVTLSKTDARPDETRSPASLVLENDRIRYGFDTEGRLAACHDKELQRDILPSGQMGNILTLYEDRPNDWDAWDVDLFYESVPVETARITAVEPLPSGPVRQGIRLCFQIGQSEIVQEVYLGRHGKRLDFETAVAWREKHRMLRVAFPVDVLTDRASFDIQYGYVTRPTHRNTLWDIARFEVVGHRYADLSGHDFGAALLNDGKYGYKVVGNTLDLNLLRSPNYPDPEADQGEHRFTYSFLPHAGDLVHSDVVPQAAQLNQGLVVLDGCSAGKRAFPIHLTGDGVSLEVVKKAEKESCLILRLVETLGRHSTARLETDWPKAHLVETDLMEWRDGPRHPLPVTVHLKPFEIRTYKFVGHVR